MKINSKILNTIYISVVLILIISGCDKNEPDKEKSNQENSTHEQVEITGLQKLFQDEEWRDEWTTTNENGKDVIITIDADITVPELDSMSVMEIQNLPFTSENKEMFLKGIFDENSIFYNDEKHMTKEQWQKKIDREIQDEIDGYEMDMAICQDEGLLDIYQESIQKLYDKKADYEDKMNNASTEYVEASKFDSDSYIGYIDGKCYTMTFTTTGYGANESGTTRDFISIESNDYVKPSQLENAVYVYKLEDSSVHKELEEVKNQCQMTKEEAKMYAEKYLNAAGIPNAVCTYADDLCWKGSIQNKEKPTVEETVYVMDGYKMVFNVGVGDSPLQYIEGENSYEDSYYDNIHKFNVYSMETKVVIEVNDYGLITMHVINPIKIDNVIGNVELLPLSDIYKIMTNNMSENPDNYGAVPGKWSEVCTTYNQLELIYFRVTDKKRENHYSYVPAWRLAIYVDEENLRPRCESMLVNAIDGTVINLIDELSAGPGKQSPINQ